MGSPPEEKSGTYNGIKVGQAGRLIMTVKRLEGAVLLSLLSPEVAQHGSSRACFTLRTK